MIKHIIDENDEYIIEINGTQVFKIQLAEDQDQIIIETDKEVWAGPIDLLNLSNIE